MPKMKSHSGAGKRFKITGSGKIKRTNAFRNHMLECKSQKQKRGYRKAEVISSSDARRVKRMLGL